MACVCVRVFVYVHVFACMCLLVSTQDHRELFDLKRPEWAQDIMPEILDGHNILDFVDPDIDAKLAELEREEEELEVRESVCVCMYLCVQGLVQHVVRTWRFSLVCGVCG